MLTYAILFFVIAVILVILEVFLPSGGILGILAFAAIIASIIFAFRQNDMVGVTFLIITVILGPILIVTGMKIFPYTPIGKRIILQDQNKTVKTANNPGIAEASYDELIGKTAKTVTSLRPSGIIEIEDERYSAVAQGHVIDKDQTVTIVNVEGNNIIVEKEENV